MVYSSSYIYAQERTGDGFAFIKRQLLWAFLGFISLVFVSQVEVSKWKSYALPISLSGAVLLVLVLIPGIGNRVGGAQRWIGLGPVNIQPAEYVKFACLFFMARQIEKKQTELSRFVPGIIAPFLLPLLCMSLLLAQPDFGSCAIIALVGFLLLFFAGSSKKHLFVILISGLLLAATLVMSTPYRRARLMTFLDPWQDPMGKGFQVLQSMLGLHNGGFWGVGLGNGKEKLFYLPEAHNDFIFAVIGEELGFVGVILVVGVFLFFILRGLKLVSDLEKQSKLKKKKLTIFSFLFVFFQKIDKNLECHQNCIANYQAILSTFHKTISKSSSNRKIKSMSMQKNTQFSLR